VRQNVGFYFRKCYFKNDIGPVGETPIT